MSGGRRAPTADEPRSSRRPVTPTMFSPEQRTLAALSGARHARSDPIAAEQAVAAALAQAPSDLDVRLAAYRFYFYNHRLDEALPHAHVIIALAARRLNISADWSKVVHDDAAFDEPLEAPGLFLQALLAWGYCAVRIGRRDEGRAAIAKVTELDAKDRFGAGRLLRVIDAHDQQEGE